MAVTETPFVDQQPPVQTPRSCARKRARKCKTIRWKTYDPSHWESKGQTDGFIQWHPPESPLRNSNTPETASRPAPTAKHRLRKCSKSIRVIPSPVQPLPSNGIRVDPFTVLPIKATESVQHTMDFFITTCNGMGKGSSSPSGPVNPHLSLLLPFALKHSVLFESIITVCRASILLSLGRPTFEDVTFVQHRGNAMAGLNAKIRSDDCTDDAALLTVTMLMTTEYLIGNHDGVRMHCEGLDKMIQLRGPLTPAGESRPQSDWVNFVQLSLVVYKSLGSFVTGQAPEVPSDSPAYTKEAFQELDLYKPLSYPQTPFSPELCMVLSQLPPGLSELSLRSRLSVQMIKLLASISAANTLADPDSPPHDANVCPATRHEHGRRQVMIQVILSSLQRMYLTTKTAIEYHLTSGLIAYMFQLRGMEPLNLFHDPLLRNFIQTMPRHASNLSKEEQHCMIWASLSVAGALGLRVAPMPESHVVMDHVLETYLESRQWPQLEKILREFCWKDEVGTHWKNVWEKAMGRRRVLLQRKKSYHDLNGPLPPEGQPFGSCESTAEDAAPEVLPQQIQELTAGASKSVREMAQAMRWCPFHSTAPSGSCPI